MEIYEYEKGRKNTSAGCVRKQQNVNNSAEDCYCDSDSITIAAQFIAFCEIESVYRLSPRIDFVDARLEYTKVPVWLHLDVRARSPGFMMAMLNGLWSTRIQLRFNYGARRTVAMPPPTISSYCFGIQDLRAMSCFNQFVFLKDIILILTAS